MPNATHRKSKGKRLSPKQRVRQRCKTAFYMNMGTVPHHRIFHMEDLGVGYLADRLLGWGLSPAAAWADAARRLHAR